MPVPPATVTERAVTHVGGSVYGDSGADYLAYEQTRELLGPELYDLLKEVDRKGRGVIKADDLAEAIEILRVARDAQESNSGQLDYRHLPKCVQHVLEEWDLDKSGQVSIEELQAAAKAHRDQKKQLSYARWMILGLFAAILLVATSTFVTGLAAMELAKEMKASGDGQILTKEGKPATMANPDMEVKDGMLMPRGAQSNASKVNKSTSLATRPAEVSKPISSTIPDLLLDEMTKLTINGADGVSHMTLRILGSTRVMAPSKCGSLVHLSSHLGMVTLDDTDLHFDEALAQFADRLGFSLEETSMHGRRLSSAAMTAGVFNFFDDFDWQCSSVAKPQSPATPYIMKTLKRVPCPTTAMCTSSIDRNQMLAGYDKEANALTIQETLVNTDEYTISIERYANHPLQTKAEIIDHTRKTHQSLQIFQGKAYFCNEMNYSETVSNVADTMSNYYPVFLGAQTRPAAEFDLPWGYTKIPSRKVRAFRLQPKEGALPVPVDYDDDVDTHLPTRLFFNGARALELDFEEVLVESLQQEASTAAAEMRKSVDLECAGSRVDIPEVETPFTEASESVQFYVDTYGDMEDELEDGEYPDEMKDAYWKEALARDEALHVGNESGRRLLSDRSPRRLAIKENFGFVLDLGDGGELYVENYKMCLKIEREQAGNGKKYVKGGGVNANPWEIEGNLALGHGCQDPQNKFSLSGAVHVRYGRAIQEEHKNPFDRRRKFKLKISLKIGGTIGGSTGEYQADCRRLSSDNLQLDSPITNSSALQLATKEHQHQENDEQGPLERSLGRRRRRRKPTKCYAWGFHVFAGIGVGGGAVVSGVGSATLKGSFTVKMGPWPKPLKAMCTGSIKVKACVKIFGFKACLSWGTTVFNEKL